MSSFFLASIIEGLVSVKLSDMYYLQSWCLEACLHRQHWWLEAHLHRYHWFLEDFLHRYHWCLEACLHRHHRWLEVHLHMYLLLFFLNYYNNYIYLCIYSSSWFFKTFFHKQRRLEYNVSLLNVITTTCLCWLSNRRGLSLSCKTWMFIIIICNERRMGFNIICNRRRMICTIISNITRWLVNKLQDFRRIIGIHASNTLDNEIIRISLKASKPLKSVSTRFSWYRECVCLYIYLYMCIGWESLGRWENLVEGLGWWLCN